MTAPRSEVNGRWTRAVICPLLLIACSPAWESLPGKVRGTVDYSGQGSKISSRVPLDDGSFEAQMQHFSSSESTRGVYTIEHLGEASGNQRFEVALGQHCKARFHVGRDRVLSNNLEPSRCVCVFDGQEVEGSTVVAGSFDERNVELQVTVTSNSADFSGGCTYRFRGERI